MDLRIYIVHLAFILSVVTIDGQTPFTVDANNRVGIGTDFPSSAFEIVGDSAAVALRISSQLGFGSARLSFLSDRGFGGEWRPGFIQSGSNGSNRGRLDFYTNGVGGAERFGERYAMSITEGRLGINETFPQTTLHVDGYTKLGDDAPKIKMKKYTGSLSSTPGVCTSFEHGLFEVGTIISMNISVLHMNGVTNILPHYTLSGGSEYSGDFNIANVNICTAGANSHNIVGQPYIVVLIYEEE